MRLFDACTVFPSARENWIVPHPGRALPVHVRAKLRASFGSLFSASDLARLKTPSRLGIALRPYESGDALKTLSLQHYVRTQELATRIDTASGRATAGIVFHAYENMEFSSSNLGNKAQLGLVLSAVLEVLHEAHLHHVEVLFVTERDFQVGLKKISQKIARWNFRYLISDFLYFENKEDALKPQIAQALQELGLSSSHVFIIRDLLEQPQNNQLSDVSDALIPFGESDHTTNQFFSGENFVKNLQNQLMHIERSLTSVGGHSLLVTGNTELAQIVHHIAVTEGAMA